MVIPIGKGHEGSKKIRYVHKIYPDDPHIQSYASYVLLANDLLLQDTDYLLSDWRIRVDFSRAYLHKVLKRDGDLCCHYCAASGLIIEEEGMSITASKKATIDHLTPVSKGGDRFAEANIVVACERCNTKKADLTVEEFIKKDRLRTY
jgi:hypothetical protein